MAGWPSMRQSHLTRLSTKVSALGIGFDKLSHRRTMGVANGRRLSLSKPPTTTGHPVGAPCSGSPCGGPCGGTHGRCNRPAAVCRTFKPPTRSFAVSRPAVLVSHP